MIYLDLYFFFVGIPPIKPNPDGSMPTFATEYFYLTKNLGIIKTFQIHSQALYVDKFVISNERMVKKELISMGRDINFQNPLAPEDFGWIVKVWTFDSLMGDSK